MGVQGRPLGCPGPAAVGSLSHFPHYAVKTRTNIFYVWHDVKKIAKYWSSQVDWGMKRIDSEFRETPIQIQAVYF